MAILPSIPAKLLTTSSDCAEANDDCAKPSAPDVVAPATAAPTFAASVIPFVSEDIIFAIIIGFFTLRKLALFDEVVHLFDEIVPREEAKTLDDVLRAKIYSNNNSRVKCY